MARASQYQFTTSAATAEQLTLLLGLLLGLLSRSTAGSSTASSSGGSGTTPGADVGKKLLHVLALESLSSCENPSQLQTFLLLDAAHRACAQPCPSSSNVVILVVSRTLAKSDAQIGSTSATLAALMSVLSLSA